MKRILFPTDFSDASRNAFQYAQALARHIGLTIDLMTVYHIPMSEASRVPADEVNALLEERKKEMRDKLRDFTADCPKEVLGDLRTDYGLFVAREITDAAEREGYDLIVMGTRGNHPAVDRILGSVTTRTMMHAPCPVLAVPEGASWLEIDHIAYATDFQPSDEHAVRQLMEFAGLFGASVHFAHVNTSAPVGDAVASYELEDYPFPFTDFSVINHHIVTEGIERFIEDKDIDVLALFIPRRRLWERLFHSSMSRRLTFAGKTPLLVFHE